MKTLCIFVTHFNPKSDGEMYYKRFKNWQIDDINFTFTSSDKNETQPIKLKIATIKFNLDLIDKLIRIIKTSAKKAHILNPEENDAQTGIERQKGTIESIINSLIMKYSVIVEYFDIFDFITELFIKLLQNHIFYNGNKRTSIISLSAILWEFGYYLKWSINASNKYIQGNSSLFASIYNINTIKESNYVEW